MAIFHCYVSSPEGINKAFPHPTPSPFLTELLQGPQYLCVAVQQRLAPQRVDHLPLLVQHLVVLEDIFADAEKKALDLATGAEKRMYPLVN